MGILRELVGRDRRRAVAVPNWAAATLECYCDQAARLV